MKHYPVTALYLIVFVAGSVALNDSRRQDRTANALRQSIESAQQREEEQLKTIGDLRNTLLQKQQSDEKQVAELQSELASAQARVSGLQQELTSLRTHLTLEIASHADAMEVQKGQLAAVETEVTEIHQQFTPFRQQMRNTTEFVTGAIELERHERLQFAERYALAFGQRDDLLNVIQQLATASRQRAEAERHLANQSAAQAAQLARLAAVAEEDVQALAEQHGPEDVRVARSPARDLEEASSDHPVETE